MNKNIIYTELHFKAVRSSGAGGQHVNKVASKVMLFFHISNSLGLNDQEKQLVEKKLKTKINKENYLILTCQDSRSQHRNKNILVKKLFELLSISTKKNIRRIKTKPTTSSKRKRIEKKKLHSLKKENRKKIKL